VISGSVGCFFSPEVFSFVVCGSFRFVVLLKDQNIRALFALQVLDLI